MKISTATSVLYRYELKDAIPLIKRVGFDGVDIWGGRPHVYRRDYSVEELKSLRGLIWDNGLAVSSFMPAFYRYPHSLSSPNPRVRQDSIDYMRECVDNAALLGAQVVLVVPDFSLYGQTRADSLQRMTESIQDVAQYALQYEVRLGIEVLYDDETDLVNSCQDAMGMIRTLGKANLGVVVDTGTLNLNKETPERVVNTLGGSLLQVHVNDNSGEARQQNLIPGEGTYDFPHLVRVLKQAGYTGYLSAELSKEYADDPESALSTTAERLRAWMDQAEKKEWTRL